MVVFKRACTCSKMSCGSKCLQLPGARTALIALIWAAIVHKFYSPPRPLQSGEAVTPVAAPMFGGGNAQPSPSAGVKSAGASRASPLGKPHQQAAAMGTEQLAGPFARCGSARFFLVLFLLVDTC